MALDPEASARKCYLMAIGLIAVPSVACMVLSGLSLARWEYLSTPRIVQRDQPATILLWAIVKFGVQAT